MPKRSVDESVTVEVKTDTVETAVSEKEADPEKKEQKYKIEKLRQNCVQLFDITMSTFDGAFFNNKETEMTISEARAKVNEWLGRKVG